MIMSEKKRQTQSKRLQMPEYRSLWLRATEKKPPLQLQKTQDLLQALTMLRSHRPKWLKKSDDELKKDTAAAQSCCKSIADRQEPSCKNSTGA